jgi:uncharacterized coiled-coil protein SlyX
MLKKRKAVLVNRIGQLEAQVQSKDEVITKLQAYIAELQQPKEEPKKKFGKKDKDEDGTAG